MTEPIDPNKYKAGTKLKSCDRYGEIIEECCPRTNKIIVKWETGQTYSYDVDWLECNAEVIK